MASANMNSSVNVLKEVRTSTTNSLDKSVHIEGQPKTRKNAVANQSLVSLGDSISIVSPQRLRSKSKTPKIMLPKKRLPRFATDTEPKTPNSAEDKENQIQNQSVADKENTKNTENEGKLFGESEKAKNKDKENVLPNISAKLKKRLQDDFKPKMTELRVSVVRQVGKMMSDFEDNFYDYMLSVTEDAAAILSNKYRSPDNRLIRDKASSSEESSSEENCEENEADEENDQWSVVESEEEEDKIKKKIVRKPRKKGNGLVKVKKTRKLLPVRNENRSSISSGENEENLELPVVENEEEEEDGQNKENALITKRKKGNTLLKITKARTSFPASNESRSSSILNREKEENPEQSVVENEEEEAGGHNKENVVTTARKKGNTLLKITKARTSFPVRSSSSSRIPIPNSTMESSISRKRKPQPLYDSTDEASCESSQGPSRRSGAKQKSNQTSTLGSQNNPKVSTVYSLRSKSSSFTEFSPVKKRKTITKKASAVIPKPTQNRKKKGVPTLQPDLPNPNSISENPEASMLVASPSPFSDEGREMLLGTPYPDISPRWIKVEKNCEVSEGETSESSALSCESDTSAPVLAEISQLSSIAVASTCDNRIHTFCATASTSILMSTSIAESTIAESTISND